MVVKLYKDVISSMEYIVNAVICMYCYITMISCIHTILATIKSSLLCTPSS